MKNWKVDLKYFNLNLEYLVSIIKPHINEEDLKETKVFIYDNFEYVDMLKDMYPSDFEIIRDMRWSASCFNSEDEVRIYINLFHVFMVEGESLLLNEYGFDADFVEDLFENNRSHNVFVLDTFIHEFKHAYYQRRGLYESPDNDEDVVKWAGINSVKEIIKTNNNILPDVCSLNITIREYLKLEKEVYEKDFGIFI